MGRIAELLGIARSVLLYADNPLQSRRAARFYAQFIRTGDLYFDIGAHLGSRVGPVVRLGARLVAVEPQPNLAKIIRRWYAGNPRVQVVEKAVGAAPGQQALLICERAPTVSTLSTDWIHQVKKSPKWEGIEWRQSVSVTVTTLDCLIDQYGEPAFCKIDTEGYEYEVVRGLTQPLRALSFEYNPLAPDIVHQAIDRLAVLGDYEFNPAPGDDLRFAWPEWRDAAELRTWLRNLPPESPVGNIYARLSHWGNRRDAQERPFHSS